MNRHVLLSALVALSIPATAFAHSQVATSTPADGATVKSVTKITLNFSETMIPATASTQLIMTAMPGMANHANLEIKNFTTNWSNSNKTLTINLKNKLKAGTYEARWQGAGADGHRMSGTVHFDVG